jgi:hypothetical protein
VAPVTVSSAPALATGVAISTPGTAWTMGTAVQVLAGQNAPFSLIALVVVPESDATTAGTTYEFLFDVLVAGVVQAQLPWIYQLETTVGYHLPDQTPLMLPEPLIVPSGSAITARVATFNTSARTFRVKVITGDFPLYMPAMMAPNWVGR